jgi:hypothetical protein
MKFDRKTVFALLVGVMMVTWAIGLALSFNIKLAGDQGMRIEDVYDKLLTAKEKIAILKSGRVLIEFLHNGTQENLDKKAAYENFVARFKGFVVLEAVEISQSNQTTDQMINPQGDIVQLDNVTATQLVDVFCQTTIIQPRECLLSGI